MSSSSCDSSAISVNFSTTGFDSHSYYVGGETLKWYHFDYKQNGELDLFAD